VCSGELRRRKFADIGDDERAGALVGKDFG
jgi:hypothetical protein